MVPIVFAIKEAAVHGFDLTIPALVLVGLVFGVLASLAPARSAAGLVVVDALHHE